MKTDSLILTDVFLKIVQRTFNGFSTEFAFQKHYAQKNILLSPAPSL